MKLKKNSYKKTTPLIDGEDYTLFVKPEDEAEALQGLLSETYDSRKGYFNEDDDRQWQGW